MEEQQPQYPAVDLMVRHGPGLAWVVGVAVPFLALVGVALAGWPWIWLVLAVPVGLGVGFVFRVFAELTQIIADMLLPK